MRRIISLGVIGLMLFAAGCSSESPAVTEAPVVSEAPVDNEAIVAITSKALGEAMINTRLEMELAAQARFAPLNSFPYDADVFTQGRLSEEAENALNDGVVAIRRQFDKGTLDQITLLEYFENLPYLLVAFYKGDVDLAESTFIQQFGAPGLAYSQQGGALEGMLPKFTELVGSELSEFIRVIEVGRQENLAEFITARALMGGQEVSGDLAGLSTAVANDASAVLMDNLTYLFERVDLGTEGGQAELQGFLNASGLGDFGLNFKPYLAP
ncbi:MAG: hypothetical protein RL280_1525 [Actinomycetota bacterium]|jgi:hypothetical protein